MIFRYLKHDTTGLIIPSSTGHGIGGYRHPKSSRDLRERDFVAVQVPRWRRFFWRFPPNGYYRVVAVDDRLLVLGIHAPF